MEKQLWSQVGASLPAEDKAILEKAGWNGTQSIAYPDSTKSRRPQRSGKLRSVRRRRQTSPYTNTLG
eukprot:3630584-Amphidinium_carterae.1